MLFPLFQWYWIQQNTNYTTDSRKVVCWSCSDIWLLLLLWHSRQYCTDKKQKILTPTIFPLHWLTFLYFLIWQDSDQITYRNEVVATLILQYYLHLGLCWGTFYQTSTRHMRVALLYYSMYGLVPAKRPGRYFPRGPGPREALEYAVDKLMAQRWSL